MKEQSMEYFGTLDEFWEVFRKYDSLHGDWERWETPTARKEHEDIFGDAVTEGEVYFKKQVGPAFDQVVKVSLRSMERLLYVVMGQNRQLSELAQRCADDEWARMRRTLDDIGGN